MTKYQQAKQDLLSIAQEAKNSFKDDKPAIRQTINDNAYYLEEGLKDYQKRLLHDYACKLHPKK